eukprot:7381358-Prymnesium_polylepis.1
MDMDMAVANVAVFPCTSCKRQARRAASLRPAAQQYTRVGDLSTKHNYNVHATSTQWTLPNRTVRIPFAAVHNMPTDICHATRLGSGRSQLYTAVRIAAMDAGSNASTNGMAKCCFDTRGISNLAFDSSSSGSKAAAVARMLSLA